MGEGPLYLDLDGDGGDGVGHVRPVELAPDLGGVRPLRPLLRPELRCARALRAS